MDELISRLTQAVGIDESTAQSAIGIIFNFLTKEGPDDVVSQVMAAIPGAQELLQQAAEGGDGGGGGLMGAIGGLVGGGGIMGAAQELMGTGLDMGQIQNVTQEVIGFAREKAGDETVAQLVSAIPGLDQFS